MSDPNPILTDQELRELFKSLLMEENGEGMPTQNLTDMEALLAFSGTPTVVPNIEKEQELFNRLHRQFGYQAIAKWLYVLLGGAVLVAAFILMKPRDRPAPVVQNRAPAEQIAAPEPVLPASVPTAIGKPNPVPPVRETVPAVVEPAADTATGRPVPAELNSTQTGTPVERTVEGTERGQFDTVFSGITKLVVKGAFFNTTFKAAAGDQVSMKGHIQVETEGLVAVVRYEREKGTLSVIIGGPGSKNQFRNKHVDAVLDFEVPAGTDLEVESTSGNITATGLTGNACSFETVRGNIEMVRVGNAEARVSAKTLQGNIAGDNISGVIRTSTGSGNTTLERAEGDIVIKSQHGDQLLYHIKGDLDVDVQSGNITGKNITLTDHMKLSTDLGNIKMDLANSREDLSFDLQTALGNIYLDASYGIPMAGRQRVNVKKGRILVKTSTGNGNQTFE